MPDTPEIPPAALEEVFRLKYGEGNALGRGPALRRRRGHFTPDDHYEALVMGLVGADTAWADVGCGRAVFPNAPRLAARLAARCRRLVGVDPDATLHENPLVHERVLAPMDTWDGGGAFDLVTLRMVAEHVDDPPALCRSVARALRPGGRAVVYTVARFSPVPMLTTCTPMALRHPLKRWLWGTETKDTFPTRFRMNTRRRLRALFAAEGMAEEAFWRLDDCRTFARFRILSWCELTLLRALRAVGLGYPEACLLGVYRRG